jgi:hypothetical protein
MSLALSWITSPFSNFVLPMEMGNALPVLPFQSYHGFLSRAPARPSLDLPRGGKGGALPEAT